MKVVLSFAFALPLLAAGCATSQPNRAQRFATGDVESPTAAMTAAEVEAEVELAAPTSRVIGTSVKGAPIVAHTLGDGADVVLVVAGIHGNESAGNGLAERLTEEARRRPDLLAGRTLIVVPVMNPDGVTANRRGNARGVDLNRNWPASNRHQRARNKGEAPLSEPESAALAKLIDERPPARIVTLHQDAALVDWDGPADALAAAMAKASGLPAKRLGALPGSMGSHLGLDRGLPIITFEMTRADDQLSTDEKWARYGEAMLIFVRGVE